ncbi:MAG: ATP-binding protein [Flavobacterium sp.]|nr:ATP-binding protein [Flavobacterium sp.]
MQKEIIVIIGGPGSGKTSIINELISKGYCCYPEISREVTLKAKADGIDQLFLSNPILFSELLLQGRIKQFENALNEPHKIVFLDRGIPDVLAYMRFIGDDYPDDFEIACQINKYSKIFVLPPWQEIYVSDNERYESYEQAEAIHHHLVNTYQSYGYQLIEVPKDTIENRVFHILEQIKN